MADNFDRFIAAFNLLHQTMRDVAGRSDDFGRLTRFLAQKNKLVATYQEDLDLIRQLRNLLIHEKTTANYNIAEPAEETIAFMITLQKQLETPDNVGQHFSRPVKCFYATDDLLKILAGIKSLGVSQFPVFNQGKLVGLLTKRGITNWFAENIEHLPKDLGKITAKDLLQVEKNVDAYQVIAQNTPLYEVEEIFAKQLKRGQGTFVILIAAQKLVHEPKDIQGIITPWDMPQLLTLI